ncbi:MULTISPECIES: extracellular solute-binding protein [unclassified Microbacterium]|uniref:extracellular solute-binding protein n=1 Tax=unclassified Microbacterium TaxID=2609290 RepID=UPI0009DDF841|nr:MULTISPECIES: extracellular solute-binding protein [unclassified Microbacterium]
MKKSLLAVTALGLATTLTLAGCSGSSGGSGDAGGPQELTFLTHWGPDQVAMLEAAGAAFTEDHPDITVKVQAVPFGNLLSTLRTQGASADGPAIVGIYDAWLPELVRDGLAAAAPADVADEVTENWPVGVVSAASNGGDVYGIPNEIDLYQLNYNSALFDAAGIAEPPADWDALVEDSAKLTTGDQQGFGLITGWNSGVVHPFLSLLASNGGSFLNEEGTASELTSPEALETAELYEKLVADGSSDPRKSTANANTTGPYLDAFVNGQTGMIVMANWWESALRDGMGDDFENVATAPIPVGPSGDESSAISYSWMTMVNGKASDARQKAAWEFLTYLNGPDSGEAGSSAMADILLSMGILPTRSSDLEAHAAELETPFLSSYVTALENATPFPTVLGGPAATDALQRQLEALVNGQVDATTAMENAARDVDAALSAAQ